MPENRHYCTCCSKKQYESKMICIRVHILHRNAWLCVSCFYSSNCANTIIKLPLSTSEDIISDVLENPQTLFYSIPKKP